ncbi:hypothetical protein GOODEAATRI_011298 [Goodea atripinnis]|uniref:Uncharacterized protein n=1 Tax=Goodea atripinnis TaxID=208336 RepID=A0ABV0MGX4_9TELE
MDPPPYSTVRTSCFSMCSSFVSGLESFSLPKKLNQSHLTKAHSFSKTPSREMVGQKRLVSGIKPKLAVDRKFSNSGLWRFSFPSIIILWKDERGSSSSLETQVSRHIYTPGKRWVMVY